MPASANQRNASQGQALNQLIQAGFDLLKKEQSRTQAKAACDQWLAAWELVKQMATPAMRTGLAFDQAYPTLQHSVYELASQMDMELHNAGLDYPLYHEHRLRFAREYLAQFPDEDDNSYLNSKRAEGESLWELGQQTEAEAVYQALIDKLPDNAWGYIGWADQYTWGHGRPVDHAQAKDILLQALARPNLDERADVEERLIDIYDTWGWPEETPQSVIDYIEDLQKQKAQLEAKLAELKVENQQLQAEQAKLKPKKLNRNAPCWCGSGKKYKHCHMNSDKKPKP